MRLFQRGNGYWYVSLKRGHAVSLRTRDKVTAQRAYRKIKARILTDKLVSLNGDRTMTLVRFTAEYLKTRGATKAPASLRSDRLALKTLADHIGDRALATITRKHIDEYIAALLARGNAPTTVNTYLRRIKAAFGVAVEWKHISANPFAGVKQLRIDQTQPRFLYGAEISALFAAITDPDFKAMVYLYIHTGCRRAELVRLKWGDITEVAGRRILTVRRTKTHRERIVRLNAEASYNF